MVDDEGEPGGIGAGQPVPRRAIVDVFFVCQSYGIGPSA
jgi:hypothetical protein